MLTIANLEQLISTRLAEAQILLNAGRPDGAGYLAGYAVELSLKLAILRNGFPETEKDFGFYSKSKVHNLNDLLDYAGRKGLLENADFRADWEFVCNQWSAEHRYRRIGAVTVDGARMTLEAIARIIAALG